MNRSQNRFLQALNADDFERLQPHLREIDLVHSSHLFDVGANIERVYFPQSGVISLVVPLSGGEIIEAGMIGMDGVAGTAAALDGSIALNRGVVQIAGKASTIEASVIRRLATSSPALQSQLYTYDQLLLAQAQQSAACNGIHKIEERLCRWLLRTRDLVEDNRIPLTQEFLSQMLAVRRTSVTFAAQDLQTRGLIKYRRGHIEIRDLDGLKAASCECYEAVKAQTARLFARLLTTN